MSPVTPPDLRVDAVALGLEVVAELRKRLGSLPPAVLMDMLRLLASVAASAPRTDGARCGAHGGGGFDCERYPGHPDEHAHWIPTLSGHGESAIKVEWT